VLLRGPWGCGKTALAVLLVVGLYTYQIAGKNLNLDTGQGYTHVVDEVHQCNNFENLYPLMQKENFIFCTNLDGELPEPFISRCQVFRLGYYGEKHLTKILTKTGLSPVVAWEVARRSKGVPRIGKKYAQRLQALSAYPTRLDALKMFNQIGVDQEGLTRLDRQYLASLPASKRTLKFKLGVSDKQLERIESYLVRSGKVKITSKGRKKW
jgi:Holliday junction resolvasome RuvABC ATP-dependent DNA helicase subunit